MADTVQIHLTKSEAIVLMDFLLRFRDHDELLLRSEADRQILYDLCGLVQNELTSELTNPRWSQLLSAASAAVTESEKQPADDVGRAASRMVVFLSPAVFSALRNLPEIVIRYAAEQTTSLEYQPPQVQRRPFMARPFYRDYVVAYVLIGCGVVIADLGLGASTKPVLEILGAASFLADIVVFVLAITGRPPRDRAA